MTEGFCWWDVTGQLSVQLKNIEIDAEVTAEFNLKDSSNILIADVLKFKLTWEWDWQRPIWMDWDNFVLLDVLTMVGVGFFELFTGGITKEIEKAEEKLNDLVFDNIPFCPKSDDKCEGQL